ncbi:MAG: MmgE/PrpD family protein [Pseudomonadota bacterium]
MTSSTIAARLAAFAVADHDAEPDALRLIGLSCLDWATVAAMGTSEPVSVAVRSLAVAEGGTEQSAIFGSGGCVPARVAALVNGTTSHALDYDDTHFAHIGHPSVVVWSAALAVAQAVGAGRDAAMMAALVGAEASVRVGQWLGRSHYEAGFHQTATAGAFGAAVASARLLSLTPDQTEHALNLLATRAAGLKSQFGTMGKPYNAGQAAAAGVEVALLAANGMTGPADGLSAPQGFGPTHAGTGDLTAFDGLGAAWRFIDIRYKFHACCHGIHASLEAVGDYVGPATIRLHPRWSKVCAIPNPKSGLEAKFSVTHAVALRMAGFDTASLETYSDTACTDTAALQLREALVLAFDDSIPDTAAVIETPHGTLMHDLADPMSLDVTEQKLVQKSRSLLGPDRAQALRDALSAADMPQHLARWMA